jgi:hypothetical protein
MGGVTQGAIASYTSGAPMDAIAVVGGTYRLVGATTGAEIALLKCATTGPVTYRLMGVASWFQADGTEFDGVFKWVNQGAATHTWGTAGSRATGGIINGGNGAQFLEGLVPLMGVERSVRGMVRLVSLALATGNGAWIGTSRSAAPTLFTGGGLGVNATPAYACAAFVAQSLTAPTLVVNTAFAGAPSTSAEQVIFMHATAYSTGMTSEGLRGGIYESGGQQQVTAQTGALSSAGSTNDRIPCISGRNITWRLIDMEITGQT